MNKLIDKLEKMQIQLLPGKSLVNKKRIFCIDDSPTIQLVVSQILSQVGYQVTGNTQSMESLKFLSKNATPDLIIMDIKMPGLEGYDLLKLIKKSRKLKDIPVMMLTSENKPFDRIRAKLLGAVGYLTKPFSAEELILKVKETLKES